MYIQNAPNTGQQFLFFFVVLLGLVNVKQRAFPLDGYRRSSALSTAASIHLLRASPNAFYSVCK